MGLSWSEAVVASALKLPVLRTRLLNDHRGPDSRSTASYCSTQPLEHLERLIEPPPAATVGLVVGFSGEIAKQLFEVLVVPRRHDRRIRGAGPKTPAARRRRR